jgi:hypothetical protein
MLIEQQRVAFCIGFQLGRNAFCKISPYVPYTVQIIVNNSMENTWRIKFLRQMILLEASVEVSLYQKP